MSVNLVIQNVQQKIYMINTLFYVKLNFQQKKKKKRFVKKKK